MRIIAQGEWLVLDGSARRALELHAGVIGALAVRRLYHSFICPTSWMKEKK